MNEQIQERLREEGLELAMKGTTLEERIKGALMFFDAMHNAHHVRVLLWGRVRLCRDEFLAVLDRRGSLDQFEPEVRTALRETCA